MAAYNFQPASFRPAMTTTSLRNVIGFSVVIVHLAAIFTILLFFLDLQMGRRVDIALIISPIFFVFSLSIVRSFVEERGALRDDARLNGSFCAMAILVTWSFLLFMLSGLVLFSMRVIGSPEELKTYLAISETSFGAFLGLIIDTLFGGSKDERT
ncbi:MULTISPECIES: hypothetical protein [Bradyrhizobium]|jgi:hypothetical protein|uniref:hypothetical protein n=1 Tax=Bradyrhizobium TaxID=374 RepID=UPI00293F3E8F|nr:hypothetical protein [Bradyrhizobium sp. NDS-1]WOH72097.1 hypothetical protein RX330_27980 [Bradyrhizobium sp. NDS-1]